MEAKQVISTNQYFYFNDILQTYKAISEQAFADMSKMEVIDFESGLMKGLEKLMMISDTIWNYTFGGCNELQFDYFKNEDVQINI